MYDLYWMRNLDTFLSSKRQGYHAVMHHNQMRRANYVGYAPIVNYIGRRWHPNKPRPPQFRRGVRIRCFVSEVPESVPRLTVTGIGRCYC